LHSIPVENCTAYLGALTCLAYEQGVKNDKYCSQTKNSLYSIVQKMKQNQSAIRVHPGAVLKNSITGNVKK
jgi:hypothetical protein